MIKAIIVDDELTAIKSLKWELENFCDNILIVKSYTCPKKAIIAINKLKPDCVFLDIEMPEMDGFQLLENLKFKSFDLIITTAFDSYALKAFKESAIDYLLKPIDSDDLINAVNKISINKSKNILGKYLNLFIENTVQHNKPVYNKIALHLNKKIIFIEPNEIIYCKSTGNYTEVFFKTKKQELISKILKDVEKMIANNLFYRTHNSYLVNINYIKEFIKNDGQYLVLENGQTIPVSRSKKNRLLELIAKK